MFFLSLELLELLKLFFNLLIFGVSVIFEILFIWLLEFLLVCERLIVLFVSEEFELFFLFVIVLFFGRFFLIFLLVMW